MIDLYTSPTPNGWKVTILLEELREAGFALGDVNEGTDQATQAGDDRVDVLA